MSFLFLSEISKESDRTSGPKEPKAGDLQTSSKGNLTRNQRRNRRRLEKRKERYFQIKEKERTKQKLTEEDIRFQFRNLTKKTLVRQRDALNFKKQFLSLKSSEDSEIREQGHELLFRACAYAKQAFDFHHRALALHGIKDVSNPSSFQTHVLQGKTFNPSFPDHK